MKRGNVLDRLVHRFQHRWETDRQFRATLSGLLALVMLLSLCAIMGAVAGVTNAALASLGGATARSYASGTPNTGVSLVKGAETFPTAVVTFSVGPSPAASPIPNSLTPLPTATGQPTATPLPTNTPCVPGCGGGGGGDGGGNGTSVTITVTGWAPATWVGGRNASVTVHTSVPNDGVNLIITFPAGTVLSASSNPNLQSDGQGNATFGFQAPAGACGGGGAANVTAMANNGGSPAYAHASVPCTG